MKAEEQYSLFQEEFLAQQNSNQALSAIDDFENKQNEGNNLIKIADEKIISIKKNLNLIKQNLDLIDADIIEQRYKLIQIKQKLSNSSSLASQSNKLIMTLSNQTQTRNFIKFFILSALVMICLIFV